MVICPFCGWAGNKFYDHPAPNARANAFCPKCTSKERHRLLYLYLRRETSLLSYGAKPLRHVLEVGPEKCLEILFRKIKPSWEYFSLDIRAPQASIKGDIQDTTLLSEIFDMIICYHVLEHVADDAKALKEMYRLLKPGCSAYIHFPVKGAVTTEDITVTDPREREHKFGQNDHVRQYGWDFPERIKAAGFTVGLNFYAEELYHTNRDLFTKYGLMRGDFVCRCIK